MPKIAGPILKFVKHFFKRYFTKKFKNHFFIFSQKKCLKSFGSVRRVGGCGAGVEVVLCCGAGIGAVVCCGGCGGVLWW